MEGDFLTRRLLEPKEEETHTDRTAQKAHQVPKRITPRHISANCDESPLPSAGLTGLKNLAFCGNTRQNAPCKSEKVSPDGFPLVAKRHRVQGTRFLITLNEVDKWDAVSEYLLNRGAAYLIASLEEAPTTGHKHIHCYCHYPKQIQLYSSKLLGAHVDVCRGTPDQNIAYVEKEGNVIAEVGERPKKKSKLTVAEAAALSWEDIQAVPVNQLKHILLAKNEAEKRKWQSVGAAHHEVVVEWIYGPTGTGKTRYVVENKATTVTYNNGFFSDWGDSRTIAFEEFRGEIPYRLFLQITDNYQGHYTVNIKGGQKVVDLDHIIITSPLSPQQVYNKQAEKEDSINQLLRRINVLKRLGPEEPHALGRNLDLNNISEDIQDQYDGLTLRRSHWEEREE